ncbi:hypothetical protein [Ensifer soli]|uniref:hypothetical protein n=1 Tax=Ciceribacter sp. sgz301302 TaxID=3342379 RepID=UPI0035B74CC2
MPIINALGSSLVAVTALGLTAAVSYAVSGLVDWPLGLLFVGAVFWAASEDDAGQVAFGEKRQPQRAICYPHRHRPDLHDRSWPYCHE